MYALPNKTQHKLIVKVRAGILAATNDSSAGCINSYSTLGSGSARPSFDEAGFNAELGNLPQPIFHSIEQHGNSKHKASPHKTQKRYITPEHNEMIKYVQQSWKGVERDYKKSVNNIINNIDINGSPGNMTSKQKQMNAKKKTATNSTPLLLSGSYHHSVTKESSSSRQDSFQPFDLEAFWGNRILKRLTEDI